MVARFASLAALALLVVSVAPAAAAELPEPRCMPSLLSLSLKPSGDQGMMHDATVLNLKNTSAGLCWIPGSPRVSFSDARGKTVIEDVAPQRNGSPDRAVPYLLYPGKSVRAEIRWLHEGATDPKACTAVAYVTLAGVSAVLVGTICRADAAGANPDIVVSPYRFPYRS